MNDKDVLHLSYHPYIDSFRFDCASLDKKKVGPFNCVQCYAKLSDVEAEIQTWIENPQGIGSYRVETNVKPALGSLKSNSLPYMRPDVIQEALLEARLGNPAFFHRHSRPEEGQPINKNIHLSTVGVACMNIYGMPDFVVYENIPCDERGIKTGVHLQTAKKLASIEQYQGPFVCFDSSPESMTTLSRGLEEFLQLQATQTENYVQPNGKLHRTVVVGVVGHKKKKPVFTSYLQQGAENAIANEEHREGAAEQSSLDGFNELCLCFDETDIGNLINGFVCFQEMVGITPTMAKVPVPDHH